MSKLPISDVDLFITTRCNLSCPYCYHPKGVQDLDYEQGTKIIDKLAVLCPHRISLNFWGGEPLLYKDVVVKLIEYGTKYWKPEAYKTMVVTNGTIYDNDLFQSFKKYGTIIQVSLDGAPETNDIERGETEKVASNLQKILVNFPDTAVRMTFRPANVFRLVQNVMYIRSLGVRKIMHQACIEDDWQDQAIKTYYEQMETLHRMRLKHPDLGVMFVDKNIRICDDMEMVDTSYCGAGRNLIAVLPNGDVHPCHRAASNALFKLGNVLTGPIIRGLFLNTDKASAGCTNCQAWKSCHTCIMTHYKVNNKLDMPVRQYCKLMLAEAVLAQKYLPLMKEANRDKVLQSMANVIANMAEDMEWLKKELSEVKNANEAKRSRERNTKGKTPGQGVGKV